MASFWDSEMPVCTTQRPRITDYGYQATPESTSFLPSNRTESAFSTPTFVYGF